LLIIGDEIEGEALHTLIVNKMKGVLYSCAVKAPSYGENRTDVLSDIALVTGGTVFDASSEKQIKKATVADFGQCKRVIVTKNSTTIIGHDQTRKELISERVSQLRTVLNSNLGIDDLKRENTKKRLAKLAGGIAVVKVGGSTEVEIFEKKDRVDDALNATVAAVQEGILPGGGTSLFYASEWLQTLINDGRTTKDLTEDEAEDNGGVDQGVQVQPQPEPELDPEPELVVGSYQEKSPLQSAMDNTDDSLFD
jgi:chaperonin GroEL